MEVEDDHASLKLMECVMNFAIWKGRRCEFCLKCGAHQPLIKAAGYYAYRNSFFVPFVVHDTQRGCLRIQISSYTSLS